jgi:hypothetical protein
MKTYLLRASEGEFDVWREAAGRVPLSVWIRDALSERAASDAMLARGEVPSPVVNYEREFAGRPGFQPDFKGGKR